MQPLFDITQKIDRKKKYSFRCEQCNNIFHKLGNLIVWGLCKSQTRFRFCSLECSNKAQLTGITASCGQCGKEVYRRLTDYNKSKSKKFFCSRSCAATYNNTHKEKGTRRSKLEAWIETQLTTIFPKLIILYNNKETINAELDIFIPALNLAFELNGIFHYEPIYGEKKLASIQNNDTRKFQACLERNIELAIIDTSQLSYFKEDNCRPYLHIIVNIINQKLSRI